MIAMLAQKLIRELRSDQMPREIPKAIEDILIPDTSKIRIFAANIQYANDIKFKLIAANAQNYDMIFIIEPWTNLKDIEGFDKYIYPNIYYNTLYIRKNIMVQLDINGFGITVNVKDKFINFMYIPPRNRNVQLPNGIIIGDINWASNNLPEPLYHEHSIKNRKGMSVINTDEIPEFNDFPSDHNSISIILNISYEKAKILDKHAIPKALYIANKTGKFIKPMKNRKLYSKIKYYTSSYWLIKQKKPKHSKIFNNNMFGEYGSSFWQELYKHDPTKRTEDYKTKIVSINKTKSNARDTNGLNVNIIYRFIKLNPTMKENILIAIKHDHLINSLIMKKREFKLESFDPKDIRIISIMPTYLKIAEQQLDNMLLINNIRPNFIGFMPTMSVHSFIALINKNQYLSNY